MKNYEKEIRKLLDDDFYGENSRKRVVDGFLSLIATAEREAVKGIKIPDWDDAKNCAELTEVGYQMITAFENGYDSAVQEFKKRIKDYFTTPEPKGFEVIVKDSEIKIRVRKMTDDEIDNTDEQYYCNDDSGTIYKYSELTFQSQDKPLEGEK